MLTREEFGALKKDERVRDRQGQLRTVRADAYFDNELGEHRVVLVDGAQVLIEKDRFHDSYMRVVATA